MSGLRNDHREGRRAKSARCLTHTHESEAADGPERNVADVFQRSHVGARLALRNRQSYVVSLLAVWGGEACMSKDLGQSERRPCGFFHGDPLPDEDDLKCTHCGGEGFCWDGADPLGDCPDDIHNCHACGGSGRRRDQTIF